MLNSIAIINGDIQFPESNRPKINLQLDVDNDGNNEIICAANAYGSRGYWYELDSIVRANYYIIWTSELFQEEITTLNILNIDSNDSRQIAIGLDDGTIVVYDAFTKNIITRFQFLITILLISNLETLIMMGQKILSQERLILFMCLIRILFN